MMVHPQTNPRLMFILLSTIFNKQAHLVSVVLPHQQRSWIGKAHFVGQLTKPTYFHPGTIHEDDGTTHEEPSSNENQEEWVLVDGTPATCAQLGLHHLFQHRPPTEVVVSGPNYGRNSTSLFSLSSGTLGGALEAAVFRKRAIALSFAFDSRDHKPDVIAGACKHSIKLIEYLVTHWGNGVDLYSINVPLVPNVGENKILYTHALQNYWRSGSSFDEVPAGHVEDPDEEEELIRESGEGNQSDGKGEIEKDAENSSVNKHRWFKWAPKFGDVQRSVNDSEPGNDGWAINKGYTSVTPLKANYMHATEVPLGELKLNSSTTNSSIALSPGSIEVFAVIEADPYTTPLIRQALEVAAPQIRLIDIKGDLSALSRPDAPLLQIRPYESLDFEHHLAHPRTSLANSYIIRKALIRKNYLWNTISTWSTKHPTDTTLRSHVPLTVTFELDYAEFLDDALLECYELHASFAAPTREWWILKPAMSDQGQGVRLFSTLAELRAIFDEWEEASPSDSDSDSDTNNSSAANDTPSSSTIAPGTITSQLRHFTAQTYIPNPLLFPSLSSRKFHLRAYTLAFGALKVYLCKELLALFAPHPYIHPSASLDPNIHLTNTCLHHSSSSTASIPPPAPNHKNESSGKDPPTIIPLSRLPHPPNLPATWKSTTFAQIAAATGTLFEAAAREQAVHFQALPNSFEVFGVDWLVDERGDVWLLEVNAFPDFGMSGEGGRGVVRGVWEGVMGCAVREFFGGGEERGGKGGGLGGMVDVLDLDMGRR